ncbi:hypothetical protein BDZ91DRAFT_720606 [Kalaharituber pfeilii]|nr:hypothetical protein BDZ91DRAFT_720606 [Kalaharituber pfeilii]
MVHIRDLTLAALLLAAPASALYSKSGPVQLLDKKNFDSEILHSEHAAIVEFFAPWCGHCKNLAPHYEKVAKNLKGLAKVAAVDCDDEKNRPLCGSYDVQGFPTLKIFKPTSKKGKPIIEDYQGPRTAKAIADAVVDKIPNHVHRITSAKLNGFLSKNNETAKAILFTPKGTTSGLYRALAIDFLDSVEFAQIRDKEEEAVRLFGVEKFPTLIILPGGDAPGKVYEGEMKKDALFKFISEIAPPKPKGTKSKKESKEKEPEKEPESESKEEVPPPPPVEEPPKVKLVIPDLIDESSLSKYCFDRKSKTCVLALVDTLTSDSALDPALAGLNAANEKIATTTKNFFFYKIQSESAHGKALAEALGLGSEHPTVVAVNGARRWYRVFKGSPDAESLLAWLDAIKLGDIKKEKIPKGFLEPKTEEEEKPGLIVEMLPDESPVEEAEGSVPVEEKPAHGHDEL